MAEVAKWKLARGFERRVAYFEGVNPDYFHAKSEMFHPTGGTRDSHLSRAMQHRCRMDAVVSSTSSEVRTRQKVSP